MIHFEPFPLLEAVFFLANRTAEVSWTSFLDTTFGSSGQRSEALISASHIITELEHRLNDSITVSEPILQKLIAPLQLREKPQQQPASNYIASLLWPNKIEAFLDWEESSFFDQLRKGTGQVSKRILNLLDEDASGQESPGEIHQLFAKINGSAIAPTAKLALLDLALNTSQYIDWLQEALTPVAAEFRRCREWMEPLLQQFRDRYSGESEEAIASRVCRSDLNGIHRYLFYPTVIYSNYVVVMSDDDETELLFCIGTLYEFLRECYAAAPNSGVQLSMALEVLSNRNRFQILTRLLEGPAYGRELASSVGVSPGAISQHIGALQGANLVTVHVDGRRTYYSLNTEGIDHFVKAFQAYFHRD